MCPGVDEGSVDGGTGSCLEWGSEDNAHDMGLGKQNQGYRQKRESPIQQPRERWQKACACHQEKGWTHLPCGTVAGRTWSPTPALASCTLSVSVCCCTRSISQACDFWDSPLGALRPRAYHHQGGPGQLTAGADVDMPRPGPCLNCLQRQGSSCRSPRDSPAGPAPLAWQMGQLHPHLVRLHQQLERMFLVAHFQGLPHPPLALWATRS